MLLHVDVVDRLSHKESSKKINILIYKCLTNYIYISYLDKAGWGVAARLSGQGHHNIIYMYVHICVCEWQSAMCICQIYTLDVFRYGGNVACDLGRKRLSGQGVWIAVPGWQTNIQKMYKHGLGNISALVYI